MYTVHGLFVKQNKLDIVSQKIKISIRAKIFWYQPWGVTFFQYLNTSFEHSFFSSVFLSFLQHFFVYLQLLPIFLDDFFSFNHIFISLIYFLHSLLHFWFFSLIFFVIFFVSISSLLLVKSKSRGQFQVEGIKEAVAHRCSVKRVFLEI